MPKKGHKNWNKVLDKNGNKRFVTCNVRINEMGLIAKALGVDRNGAAQDYYTDLIMQNLADFMPRESGRLIGSMSKQSPTRIRVETPYARFLFFGLKKDGTPVEYDNANPQGESHWDRRMAAARGAAIHGEMIRYLMNTLGR